MSISPVSESINIRIQQSDNKQKTILETVKNYAKKAFEALKENLPIIMLGIALTGAALILSKAAVIVGVCMFSVFAAYCLKNLVSTDNYKYDAWGLERI